MRHLLFASLLFLSVPAFASAPEGEAACQKGACDGAQPTDSPTERSEIDLRNAPSRGGANAKVTVVEFADFECPFCARGAKTLKQLEARYGQRIRVVFKNQPLPQHPHARLAADAALAANAQGHFWQFYDWLYSSKATLETEALVAEAGRLGMDTARFRADLDSGTFEARVSADQAEAKRLGIAGTPTYFINGLRVTGAQPAEALEKLIDAELTR